jgi:ABC-type antimicrobial peptide transport system permease subunit
VLGLYGVTAFFGAARTREIGIRIALGASRGNVERMVLRAATQPVAVGTLTGIGLGLLVSRWFRSQLFGVAPTDMLTHVVAVLGMLVTTVIATWRPARKAASIDPAVTLRTE